MNSKLDSINSGGASFSKMHVQSFLKETDFVKEYTVTVPILQHLDVKERLAILKGVYKIATKK